MSSSASGDADPQEPATVVAHDPFSALRNPALRHYLLGNVLAISGMQMEMLAVRWELNERYDDPMLLGYVGLVQVLPVLALALIAGHVADHFDRRLVVSGALLATITAALGLLTVSRTHGPLWAVYACLFVNGSARAFLQPAKQALLPQLVDRSDFSNAVTWNSGGFHLATVVGPSLGGVLLGVFKDPAVIYGVNAACAATYLVLLFFVKLRRVERTRRDVSARSLLAGVSYVWNNEVVLGAMALDMFAVLLGGATTLLPVFAKKILHVGPIGFGLLEAAPAAGALLMSFTLAVWPPLDRAGRQLLWAVAGFGITMITFGLSRSLALSLFALFLSGALDNISVVIRQTLIQLQTPDSMRGRVSAVNGVFISTSNELGGYESGLTAAWFGTEISVIGGGIGTLFVVLAAAFRWPRLRNFGRLDQPRQAQEVAP
jgi:MFS family permease